MATLMTNNTAGNILIQTGIGIPNHVAPKGSQFTDITTANLYINKDGFINWVLNIDTSNSGATSNIYSFNTFSSTTVGQTFVSTSIANDTIILSGIGLNILTDDVNNVLTFSSATSADTFVTGGTYNNNTFTFTNNNGNKFDISVNTFSGLTINGDLSTNTISATTYYNLPVNNDTFVTGGTYSNGSATFTNNTGGTFSVNGFYTGATDVYVTGLTFNPSNYDLTISRNDNVSFTESLAILSSDMVVTGGTYNPSTGIATFTNNSGGTFNVNGFLTGMTDTYVTGLTYSNNLITLKQNAGQPNLSILIDSMSGLTINGGFSANTISATTYYNLPTDIRVTGGTYNNGTILFTNNTGGTFNVTGLYSGGTDVYTTGATYSNNTFTYTNNTGGTFDVSFNSVTGLTIDGILSATTISGDTIYANNFPQLPLIDNETIDYYVSSGDTFIRLKESVATPSGGTRTFVGNVNITSGLSASTISATTYYNLPTDIRVTGGTYNNGTILFTNNTGGTFNVTGLYSGGTDVYTTGATYNNNTFIYRNNTGGTFDVSFNSVTGLTVDGILSATTYLNLPSITGLYLPLSGGTVTGGTIFTDGITANTISNVDYIDFKTSPFVTNPTGGTLYFDSNENALSYKPVTNQNDVTINLGQESVIRIFNDTGIQINNGQVLHITGATSGIPTVALANASNIGETFTQSLAQSSGVATHDIPHGEYGFMTNFGIVRDLNTSAFTSGQELFLSDVINGGITNDPDSIAFTSRISTIGWCLTSDATNGKIYVKIENENPVQSLTQQEVNILLGNTISTGAYSYTGMTKASSTTVNVSPMNGWIVYNTYEYSLNPLVLNVYYSGGTNIPVTNINSSLDTYFLVNSGGTLYQQTTYPTPQERRENIFLGRAVHPNKINILNVEQNVDFDVSPLSCLRDLWKPIKLINEGVVPSNNGANLQFKTSYGTFWGNGIGWDTNELNPNSIIVPAYSPATFYYTTQTGGSFTVTANTIDTTKYDVGGVITNVPGSGGFTTQRIYMSQSGVIRIQYGQEHYPTLVKAIAAIPSETFIENSDNGIDCILIGLLTVKDGITALNNTDDAVFTLVSKFGEILGGTGGLSTTTLQQAYNNSTNPEITTNSTLNAVQFRGGTGSNLDSNIIIENNSGVQTGKWLANGGLSATTISATTYYNLPTDIRITGGTYSSGIATFTNNTGGTFNVTGFYTSGSASGDFLPLSGGTVTGPTTFNNGLTANTISATTYQNLPDAELDTKIFGYRVNSATQKAYKTTQTIAGSTMATGTINGESIYCQKFYAHPNEKINEIVFRIMTAGASGLGLAQARILIYRSKLNANNEIIGGDLELDTNVNINTLSTGLKVVTGLNHTLSNNTYKNVWFMCIRNYQSGSLSLKFYTTADIVSKLYDISASSTATERDLGWYFSCLYTSATPASMPVSASTSPSTTAVASTSGLVAIGYSNY